MEYTITIQNQKFQIAPVSTKQTNYDNDQISITLFGIKIPTNCINLFLVSEPIILTITPEQPEVEEVQTIVQPQQYQMTIREFNVTERDLLDGTTTLTLFISNRNITLFSEIYSMAAIDDIRLQKQKEDNICVFMNSMLYYLRLAIPFLDSPFLLAQKMVNKIDARFDDVMLEAKEDNQTIFETGKFDFELCVVKRVVEYTEHENIPIFENIQAEYDSETGIMTISEDVEVLAGDVFTIDFYTDGWFRNQLNFKEIHLLALAFGMCWYKHKMSNWLDSTPKPSDKSASFHSESSYINSDTVRYRELSAEFFYEKEQYEWKNATDGVLRNRNRRRESNRFL